MSNINPQPLFDKFAFLGRNFDMSDIDEVHTGRIDSDTMAVQIRHHPDFLRQDDVPRSANKVIFFDRHGKILGSVNHGIVGAIKSAFAILHKERTVGSALSELGCRDEVAYIVKTVVVRAPMYQSAKGS